MPGFQPVPPVSYIEQLVQPSQLARVYTNASDWEAVTNVEGTQCYQCNFCFGKAVSRMDKTVTTFNWHEYLSKSSSKKTKNAQRRDRRTKGLNKWQVSSPYFFKFNWSTYSPTISHTNLLTNSTNSRTTSCSNSPTNLQCHEFYDKLSHELTHKLHQLA